jgi:proline dehydrogenase
LAALEKRLVLSALARWASRAYVAGPELEDALRVCERFAARQLPTAIGFWNVAGASPRKVANAYLASMDAIVSARLDSVVCVKASALACSRDLTAELVARAIDTEVGLHFDAMRPESAQATWDLIATARARFRRVGCTLPGRWQRSVRDAHTAAELGTSVRVVKGQWADPERDLDPRDGFLRVIDRLAGRACHVAVATHDTALAREALRRLRDAGTACQLELLFGLPLRASLDLAREAGVATRVYIPYGSAWIPYCLSQLRANPGILVWFMRDALFGRAGKLAG